MNKKSNIYIKFFPVSMIKRVVDTGRDGIFLFISVLRDSHIGYLCITKSDVVYTNLLVTIFDYLFFVFLLVKRVLFFIVEVVLLMVQLLCMVFLGTLFVVK